MLRLAQQKLPYPNWPFNFPTKVRPLGVGRIKHKTIVGVPIHHAISHCVDRRWLEYRVCNSPLYGYHHRNMGLYGHYTHCRGCGCLTEAAWNWQSTVLQRSILCVWRVIYYALPTLEMAVTISEIKRHLGLVAYIMSIWIGLKGLATKSYWQGCHDAADRAIAFASYRRVKF